MRRTSDGWMGCRLTVREPCIRGLKREALREEDENDEKGEEKTRDTSKKVRRKEMEERRRL